MHTIQLHGAFGFTGNLAFTTQRTRKRRIAGPLAARRTRCELWQRPALLFFESLAQLPTYRSQQAASLSNPGKNMFFGLDGSIGIYIYT